ncbi:MAG: hypothetical protein LUG99_04590 [Lachnospiraceae bacterium]|nr:hypothetical protein [Lachnospiraceae bacterium]
MEFDSGLYLLSSKFITDYPASTYPELMHKQGRPYTCLLIDSHEDYFICVPFRSDIRHKNSFLFAGTKRSRRTSSGLDYSKIVIIKNSEYIDSSTPAIVDQDEYNEMVKNLPTIVLEANDYVNTYIGHVTGKGQIHPREFSRKYQFSTLPYFHDVMKI